jgi:hypothetical protein
MLHAELGIQISKLQLHYKRAQGRIGGVHSKVDKGSLGQSCASSAPSNRSQSDAGDM